MATILCILVFAIIGAAIGFAGTLLSDQGNKVLSIILGVVGSLGVSWIASLLGLGAGFLAFSLWGIIFGVLGACILVGVYAMTNRR